MTESEQARKCLEGEIASFQPRLVKFAYSLTHDQEEAADLAQDTIVRALAAGNRFTPGTNLRAWLFRILHNLHLNRLRSSAHHPRPVSLDDVHLAASGGFSAVEEKAVERASLEQVLHEFRRLPSHFSVPIYLCSVEELSYAEIAARLGIPIGTVMSRIYRGRRLLLARLAEK
jgi:RNA polymerase sigma-70 factor (ECF subfamily)